MKPKNKSEYARLCETPTGADRMWFRKRGYEFERLLADLLESDYLEPRTSYKTVGEQIDGSFFFDGKVFLLEAKWHKEERPASDLYAFKGKIDGKLAGTLGVFISMSGYSRDAADALAVGKSLNLLLFDKDDVDVVMNEGIGFRSVLKLKLRKAAEEGVVYFPVRSEFVTRESTSLVAIAEAPSRGIGAVDQSTLRAPDLIVVCEGESDRALLSYFAQRILAATQSDKSTNVVLANGKLSVPKLANAMHSLAPKSKILVVVDSDGDIADSEHMLEQHLEFEGWDAVIPDPEIEVWVGLDRQDIAKSGRGKVIAIMNAAHNTNIDGLQKTQKSFAKFYNVVSS